MALGQAHFLKEEPPTVETLPLGARGQRPDVLTLHTAAAGLQDPGIHVHPRLGHELVTHEVGVVGRGDEVVTQRLRHVLMHAVVLRVEDVTGGAPGIVGKACSVHRSAAAVYLRYWAQLMPTCPTGGVLCADMQLPQQFPITPPGQQD